MGTLLMRRYAALSRVTEDEARFLSTMIDDAVRVARRRGRYSARFHGYTLRARREPLGARLCAVTWCISAGDEPVARDTTIQFS